MRWISAPASPATEKGGDPALAVIGLHELAHGSDQNIPIPRGSASENDVKNQVKESIPFLPPNIKQDIHQ